VATLLKEIDVTLFVAALLLMVLQVLIAAVRWQLILTQQNIDLNYRNTLQVLWSGLFFNQAMPSSVGGDLFRGYYLKKQGLTLGRATVGVLLDRLFGMVGLVLLVLISLPLLFDLVSDSVARGGVLMIAMGTSVGLLLLFFSDRLPANFSHYRLIRGFYSLSQEGRNCLVRNERGLVILAVSVMIHLFSVGVVTILAGGLGVAVNWSGILLMVPLVTLIMVVPISIAGWGVREGGMVVGLGYLNVIPSEALALSILYGLSMLLIALPGGVVWLLHRPK